MLRLLWLLWAPLAGAQTLVDAGDAPVEVKPAKILVKVRPFADGVARRDTFTAVDVTMSNGTSDLEAVISATSRDIGADEVGYTRAVELPRGARKHVQLGYRLGTGGASRAVAVTAGGETLRVEVPFQVLSDDDVSIAVIGLDAVGVTAVGDTWSGAVPGPRPRPDADADRRVRAGLVPLDTLPERSALWQGFDWVVWPRADPSALTPGQADALRHWVATGGHLLVTVTDTWRAVDASPLAPALPVRLTGTRLADVTPLLVRLDAHDTAPASTPVATAEVRAVPGRRILVLSESADGTPLWVAGSYGAGTVHVVLADPSTAPLSDHVRREALWRRLLWLPPPGVTDAWFWADRSAVEGSGSYLVDRWTSGEAAPHFSNFSALPGADPPLRQLFADLDLAAPTSGDFYAGGRTVFTTGVWYDEPDPLLMFEGRLFEHLQDIPGVAPLPLSWLTLFSVVYLLFIGPIDYFVLRAIGRQPWTWVTFPIWIAGFSAVALVGTAWVKGDQAVLTRMDVVDVFPGTDLWAGDSYLGVFSTRKATLTLASDVTDAVALPMRTRGSAWDTVAASREGSGVLSWRAETWTLSHARTAWVAPRGDAGVEVALVPGTRTWRITNRLGVDLEDAVLTAGGFERRLGPIADGASFDVDSGAVDPRDLRDLRQVVIAGSRDLGDAQHGPSWAIQSFLEHPEPGRGHVDLFGEVALVGVTSAPHESVTITGLRPLVRAWTVYRVPLVFESPLAESVP